MTLISLGLLVGIIYGLRRHQSRALSDAAERDQPLPPLPADPVDNNDTPPSPPVSPAPMPADPISPEPKPASLTPAASQPATPVSIPDASNPMPDLHWRERCAALRESGEHEAALAACTEGWPQWQSFQQGALVIRAVLRDLDALDRRADNTDWVAQTQREIWLERLFRLAAQASFLHDEVDDMPNMGWRTLNSRFDRREVEKLPMPWHQLGYRKLRLLNQSDCRAMVKCFGEPTGHLSAKSFHRIAWTK